MTRSGSVSSGYKYLEDLCIHLVTNPLPTPSFTISAKFRDMERVVASSNRTCGFARIGFRHRSEVSQSRTSPRFLLPLVGDHFPHARDLTLFRLLAWRNSPVPTLRSVRRRRQLEVEFT